MNIDSFDIDLCREQISTLRKYTKFMTVLLVEDYLILQKSLEKIFLPLFKEVVVASDGAEAFELYKQKISSGSNYDIVFSDIAMPNMDGVELTKHIKKIYPQQVIIIFSAHQDSKYLLDLINLDVKRFISKPISLKNLLDELLLACKNIYEGQNLSNIVKLNENVVFNKAERTIYIDSKPIRLSNHEQFIIELLVSKIGQSVCTNEIIGYLYANGVDIEFDNVRKIVYKLRKKLSNDLIQNIRSVGYSLRSL